MTYNREEILSLLNLIVVDDEFTQDDADDFYYSLPDEIKNEYQDYAFGASKFVLIPNCYDYVIKIPFNGTYYNNYSGWSGLDDFCPFELARDGSEGWDYCAAEVRRYTLAEENGFADFLAKTEFLGLVHGYPIYIQEKCLTFSGAFDVERSHHSQEDRKTTASLIDDVFFHMNLDWLTDCRLCFGEERFLAFIKFIEDEEWDDLREDNIGYLNKRAVLIDYSGYDE